MAIRSAVETDLPVIRAILREHAVTEADFPEPVRDELDEVLFGPNPLATCTLAVDDDDAIVGLALWYRTFSSWALTTGIWLEDLYVRGDQRGAGTGAQLMTYLRTQTAGRIDWDVTQGNDAAERFYSRLGARPLSGLIMYRWDGDQPTSRTP